MKAFNLTEEQRLFEKLLQWRTEHISDRQTTLILAFVIGILASLAGYMLHSLIHLIEFLLTEDFKITSVNYLYLLFPVVGIYLTSMFVKHIVKDQISHGITRVLYAISAKQSRLRGHNCWSSVIASAITIGFGGSVGAEAPIVLTGAAIGSNLGKLFNMSKKTLMLLVGCGASAAIAGIFKAPIAGLVFTLEVLMVDLSMASLLPILISGVTATCLTYVLVGSETLFSFHIDAEWSVGRVPATILLGLFCGIVSLYFIRTMTACEDFFGSLSKRPYLRLAVGGSMLSLLIFLFPSLYGEGYSALNTLMNGQTEADWNVIMNNSLFYGHGNMLIVYVACVLVMKVFATSATNGSGGCGGTFAPSLFIGGFAGFLFARIWNMNDVGIYIPEKNFTLLGMAGVMAGVMHAPLTGVFLIAEITGGYQLFIPLMIVCICAFLAINLFEPHSIYGMRLARQGKLLTHHIDSSVLTLMSLESLVEKEYMAVPPDMKLGKLIHVISRSHTDFIPVLNGEGALLGEINVVKIRNIMFRTELYQRFSVEQLMVETPAVVGLNDPMKEVMAKFDTTNEAYLPVVDLDKRLLGYLSRARVYKVYRQIVADYSAE